MNTTIQEQKYNINANTFLEVLQETLVYAETVEWFDSDELTALSVLSSLMKKKEIKTPTKRNIREANK